MDYQGLSWSPALSQDPALAYPSQAKEPIPLISILVAIFIIMATGMTAEPPWNHIVRATGVILVIACGIRLLQANLNVSAEIGLYAAWLLWSLSGIFVARSTELMFILQLTCLQFLVMALILSTFTTSRRLLTVNLVAFLIGAAIVGSVSVVTGSYRIASTDEQRLTAFGADANEFGWLMARATVGMQLLWMLPFRWYGLKHLLLIGGMLGAAIMAILSGSRFGLFGLILAHLLWIMICYRREVFRRPLVLLLIVIGFGLGGAWLFSFAQETAMGQRVGLVWNALTGRTWDDPSAGRIGVYLDAWRVFLQHPILGVGLGNFQIESGGFVAHSDYMEVCADTGIIGAVLYFSIYAVLWRRSGRVARLAKAQGDQTALRIAQSTRIALLVLLFLGFGGPHFSNKASWILLAPLIGCTHALYKQLSDPSLRPYPGSAGAWGSA